MEQQKFGNTSGFTRESGPRELTAIATQCRVSMVQSGSHRGGLAWHYPAYFPFWFKRHIFVSQTSTRYSKEVRRNVELTCSPRKVEVVQVARSG
jgi:hypothetical protein